jgi:hypothetical protein
MLAFNLFPEWTFELPNVRLGDRNKMIGSLTQCQTSVTESVWVKGDAKMSKDVVHDATLPVVIVVHVPVVGVFCESWKAAPLYQFSCYSKWAGGSRNLQRPPSAAALKVMVLPLTLHKFPSPPRMLSVILKPLPGLKRKDAGLLSTLLPFKSSRKAKKSCTPPLRICGHVLN